MKKAFKCITVFCLLLLSWGLFGDTHTVVSYEQIIDNAIPIREYGLFEANREGTIEKVSEHDGTVMGNYLVHKEGYLSRGDTGYLMIRTIDNTDIVVGTRDHRCVYHAFWSFDNYILAKKYDDVMHDNGINYVSVSWVLLSIDEGSVVNELLLDSSEIDDKPLGDPYGFPPKYLVVNGANNTYIDFDLQFQTQGNIFFYFSPPWLTGKFQIKNYVFKITPDAIKCIGVSDSPLDLQIPELTGCKKAVQVEDKLYIHDMGSGTSVLLGTILDHSGFSEMINYLSEDKKRYFLDLKTLQSYPAPEGVRNAYRFDNGYYYIDPDAAIDFFGFDEDGHRILPGGEKQDKFFFLFDNEGKTIKKILTLQGFPVIEKVKFSNGRLYISGWQIGIVYNTETCEVEEVYKSEYGENDNYTKVVYLQPFAGKTYIYLSEPYNIHGL